MPRETEHTPLLLHESHGADGAPLRIELRGGPEGLELSYEGKLCALEPEVVFAVFDRLARELDDAVALEPNAFDLGQGATLRSLRHLARYDVIARDYLVLERPNHVPLVELATSITAALVHLAESVAQ
jgi:hypothetical protein